MLHTRRVSPITPNQQGFIAEQEFVKRLIAGSGGQLEIMAPATDDGRRDLEVHIGGQPARSVVFQVRSRT